MLPWTININVKNTVLVVEHFLMQTYVQNILLFLSSAHG